ncbi:MAG: hypothetical protein ACE5GN_03800, partial [Waddliaceae bacterium]
MEKEIRYLDLRVSFDPENEQFYRMDHTYLYLLFFFGGAGWDVVRLNYLITPPNKTSLPPLQPQNSNSQKLVSVVQWFNLKNAIAYGKSPQSFDP